MSLLLLIKEESHPEETHTLRNSRSCDSEALKLNSAKLMSSVS